MEKAETLESDDPGFKSVSFSPLWDVWQNLNVSELSFFACDVGIIHCK